MFFFCVDLVYLSGLLRLFFLLFLSLFFTSLLFIIIFFNCISLIYFDVTMRTSAILRPILRSRLNSPGGLHQSRRR